MATGQHFLRLHWQDWPALPCPPCDRHVCPTNLPLQIEGPRKRLAYGWLSRLLHRTCEAAPGPTEAILHEQMHRTAAPPAGASMEIMGRYMPEVLQVRGTKTLTL